MPSVHQTETQKQALLGHRRVRATERVQTEKERVQTEISPVAAS